ncbi:MAG: 16S rRNA (cytosine(967)-C(5))-methyltransferase RsmB [Bacillota bacterium]
MSVKNSARDLALMVLKEVDSGDAYANLALSRILEEHSPAALDRAFATELVYGTLRTLNTLDWIIQQNIRTLLEKQAPWVRNILRLGVYQIMYLDRVPAPAAVNEAANQARRFAHPGAVKFVNGVLRNILRGREHISFPPIDKDPVGHITLKYSHPSWLVERWVREMGAEETIRLCEANNRPAPGTVRTNTLKISREELIEVLAREGVRAEKTRYAPEGIFLGGVGRLRGFPPFEQGLFQVQDESSMLVAHALSPEPGRLVLDAAAAPGGKATHLAQLTGDSGTILALDVHPHKLKLISENCARLGIKSVRPVEADAVNMPPDLYGAVDYVLLDAPCTGTGVIRRKPDSRWRKTPEGIAEITSLQRKMIMSVARCVRPGGVFVYSTCSVLREENIDQVEFLLKSGLNFHLESLNGLLSRELAGGGELARGFIQLFPHINGTDGFFMARFRLAGQAP